MSQREALVTAESGEREDAYDPQAVPASIAWHGTCLRSDEVILAVNRVAAFLARHGVDGAGTVLLESDDSGRTMLTLLALADRGASILLVDDARVLPEVSELASITHRVVLRDAYADEIDMRPVLRGIERAQSGGIPYPLDLGRWFARDRALGVRSSGTTTGVPELIWKSGPELLENARATARAVGYGSSDRFLPLLPLSGQYGSSVMILAAVLGAGIVFCTRTKITEILRTAHLHGVTATDAVPLVYRRLIDEVERSPSRLRLLKSVRVFGVGGESLSQAQVDDFQACTGRSLINGYGLSQIGNVGFADGREPDRLRLIDTFVAKTVDAHGRALSDGGVGRVLLGRRDGLPIRDGQTWFDTGDVGRLHQERLEIIGREGAVNRNGVLTHFSSVERRLADAGIRCVAVTEAPDASARSPRYWIFIEDPLRRPLRHWRDRIERALDVQHRPDRIQVLARIPVDASGKTSRRRLSRFATAVGGVADSEQHDDPTQAGRIRAVARAARHELTAIIAEISDVATAQRDFRAMMHALEHAEGELALWGTPPRVPIDVFMTRNAILESFAVYCLIPSLWAARVRVRPATGSEGVLARIQELFDAVVRKRISTALIGQEEFVREIIARPSVVLFTGRRSNAESVAARLTRAHLFMFFGRGVNPVVVGRDADVHRAAGGTVMARLYNGGQDCLAPDLILVHEDRLEELVASMSAAIERYQDGNGSRLARLTAGETVLSTVHYLLEHAQGILEGGRIDYSRRTVEPTLVRISLEDALEPIEHFAPIFSIATFAVDDEVFELLSSSVHRDHGFGITSYGWNERYAQRLSDHYMLAVDQTLADAAMPFEPFGGNGVESGYVVHRGKKTLGPINITRVVRDHAFGMPENRGE